MDAPGAADTDQATLLPTGTDRGSGGASGGYGAVNRTSGPEDRMEGGRASRNAGKAVMHQKGTDRTDNHIGSPCDDFVQTSNRF
jgi:hypothetical protein